MKTLLILSLLFCISGAYGQTEAPVVWGESCWFGCGALDWTTPVLTMGDTLLFAGPVYDQSDPPLFSPQIRYSHDNGSTFSPIQRLDSNFCDDYSVQLGGSNGRLYVFAGLSSSSAWYYTWLKCSTDGGVTWNNLIGPTQHQGFQSGFVTGMQILCVFIRQISETEYVKSISISDDGGAHWRSNIPVPGNMNVGQGSLNATRSHFLLLTSTIINSQERYVISTSNRTGQNWTPFTPLPAQPLPELVGGSYTGDTSSETAVFVSAQQDGFWTPLDLYAIRTTDGGASWSDWITLTTDGALWYRATNEMVFCRGKLFGVAYQDANNPEPTQRGIYWRFTANHGKNWYPSQRIDGYYSFVKATSGQFVGNEVRLYWNAQISDTFWDYRTCTGILQPDTIYPDLIPMFYPHDTATVGDSLRFQVNALDNDTLSEAVVHIEGDVGMHANLTMTRQSPGIYELYWHVPAEGNYRFRFEAEDFWENRIVVDDTSEFIFFVRSGSAVDRDFVSHPSSFILSAYPNPFNPTTTIALTLPHIARARLAVYDLLGREVAVLHEGLLEAGEHAFAFDGTMLPSGVYLARWQAGKMAETQKLLLLK
jgi:hypothetical protein